MMRTNAWIIVERDRAISWRTWWRWYRGDQDGPEPPITNFEKKAVLFLVDQEYIFRRFLRPTILGKVWIMLSVYDISRQQIQAGYSQLGDAASGGDFGCAGIWWWVDGMDSCRFIDWYPWQPNQVLKFMPPTYDDSEPPGEIPATEVRDVNRLFGQPPREFPA